MTVPGAPAAPPPAPPGPPTIPTTISTAVTNYNYSLEDLAKLRDDDVAALVEDPSDRFAVVAVKVWHRKLRDHLKLGVASGGDGFTTSQLIAEMRNTGTKDAFGRLRNGKAYTNGIPPKTAYEGALCSRVGTINLPRDQSSENLVHLCEPRNWSLDRNWKTADYIKGFKEWIAVGENGADLGLLKFYAHRRKNIELMVKVYGKFMMALPRTFTFSTEKEAEDISEMVSEIVELMQFEITTIAKKHQSLGRAEAEDNGKQLLPFWLADVLSKDKVSESVVRAPLKLEPTSVVEQSMEGPKVSASVKPLALPVNAQVAPQLEVSRVGRGGGRGGRGGGRGGRGGGGRGKRNRFQ